MTNKYIIHVLKLEKEKAIKEKVPDWEYITALGDAINALEFAKFTAKMLFDDWETDCKDLYPELACRRLVELGIVELNDGVYSLKECEEEDADDSITKANTESQPSGYTSICTGTCYGRDTFSAETKEGEKIMIVPKHIICDLCGKRVGTNIRYFIIKSKCLDISYAGSYHDNRKHHICIDCMKEIRKKILSDNGGRKMSGGSLNYFYEKLEEHASDFGDKELEELVRDLSQLFYSREWYLSGDYGEGEWNEARDKFKDKWFGEGVRTERIEKYLEEVRKELLQSLGSEKVYCRECKYWIKPDKGYTYGECSKHTSVLWHPCDTCIDWKAGDKND